MGTTLPNSQKLDCLSWAVSSITTLWQVKETSKMLFVAMSKANIDYEKYLSLLQEAVINYDNALKNKPRRTGLPCTQPSTECLEAQWTCCYWHTLLRCASYWLWSHHVLSLCWMSHGCRWHLSSVQLINTSLLWFLLQLHGYLHTLLLQDPNLWATGQIFVPDLCPTHSPKTCK
jgi:hypothetical protein